MLHIRFKSRRQGGDELHITGQVDVWSSGLVLYALLSCNLLFASENEAELRQCIIVSKHISNCLGTILTPPSVLVPFGVYFFSYHYIINFVRSMSLPSRIRLFQLIG